MKKKYKKPTVGKKYVYVAVGASSGCPQCNSHGCGSGYRCNSIMGQ